MNNLKMDLVTGNPCKIRQNIMLAPRKMDQRGSSGIFFRIFSFRRRAL